MSMIKAEKLTFAYPGSFDNVFEDVSFQLDTRWKLGLVGRNGRGKTTLLRLLMGEYEYGGAITASVDFDYFPCPVADRSRPTAEILREICPQAEEWQLARELARLQVEPDVPERTFDTLSNGEQTKVLLAALFLNQGRFLLIDEPTNHLDAEARALVASYLRGKQGFILVSHDRAFLDGCVDHILALNRTGVEVCGGNFSAWMEDFTRRQDSQEARNQRLQKDISRLQQAARRTEVWARRVEASKIGALDKGYVGHKSAKMMKRAKAIDARRREAAGEKAALLRDAERTEPLKLSPLAYHADLLAELREAAVCYDGRPVSPPVTLQVRRGDRVALGGPNGCGKSSLLKLLSGQPLDHTGRVSLASGLVISRVPQDAGHLRGSLTDFARGRGIDETLFRAILRKLDFQRKQFEKDLAELSGGQKKKVLLAESLCRRAHLYIWDEPLNFMDVYSRIQIETLLREFAPTMVFVEHDRAFRSAVATKVVEL